MAYIQMKKPLISCGVPQVSILGPVLFLLYINDLPSCLENGIARLFADDTNMTSTGCNLESVENKMQIELSLKIKSRAQQITLKPNIIKVKILIS
jgi:hypothetical protein